MTRDFRFADLPFSILFSNSKIDKYLNEMADGKSENRK